MPECKITRKYKIKIGSRLKLLIVVFGPNHSQLLAEKNSGTWTTGSTNKRTIWFFSSIAERLTIKAVNPIPRIAIRDIKRVRPLRSDRNLRPLPRVSSIECTIQSLYLEL